MASSTWDGLSCSNVSVLSASVSGFAQVRIGRKMDYAFVIEMAWSDGRTRFLKRTFSDFVNLQYKLNKTYPQEMRARCRNGKTVGCLSGRRFIFQRNDSKLAEKREPDVNRFVQDILKLPDNVSRGSLVLSFFESWKGDPQPFNDDDDDVNSNHDDDEDDGYFLDLTELMLSDDLDNQVVDSSTIWGSDVDRVPKLLRRSFSDLTCMYDPYYLGDFESVNEEDADRASDCETDKCNESDEYAYSEPGGDFSLPSARSGYSICSMTRSNSYSSPTLTGSDFALPAMTSQQSRMSIGSESNESVATTSSGCSSDSVET